MLAAISTTPGHAQARPADRAAATAGAAKGCGRADSALPRWARARRMTVLNDSVLLSGEPELVAGFPCWRVELIGRPALMLRQATHQLRTRRTRVAPLVVVGLGYNSLWERRRRNHGRWARRFDDEASRLLRTLRRAGAQQFIWVTLRTVTAANSPSSAWHELDRYSWYFPYVNERLRRLDARRNRLVLADWAHHGASPRLTYDTIHLNQRGGRLMQKVIEAALYEAAHAQARGS